jgi:hypothetical protein
MCKTFYIHYQDCLHDIVMLKNGGKITLTTTILDGQDFETSPCKIIRTRQTTYVQRNMQSRLRNNCCRVKVKRIAYSKSVCVALVIKHSKGTISIILSFVASPAALYFSTLYHKRRDFLENVIEHKMRFDFL